MTKINNVIKANKKFETFMFIQRTVNLIGRLHFNNEVSSSELITFYVKKAICSREEDGSGTLCRAYLSVAILLAFLNRLTSPFRTPSSIDEMLDMENLSLEDLVAESVGLIAKASFEGDEEKIEEYSEFMYDFADELLEEAFSVSEPLSDAEKAAISEQRLKANEEPVPADWAAPV